MPDPMYAREKMLAAVKWLAKHPGEIRPRLIVACDQALAAINDGDLSTPEFIERWRSIRARIAGMGTVYENSAFETAINALPVEEAVSVVEDIVDLSSAVDEHMRTQNPQLFQS